MEQRSDRQAWLLRRAQRYARHNNAEGVEEVTLKVLDESPDDLVALGMLAAARFQSGRPAEAIDVYERALQIDPGQRLMRFQLGLSQAALGRNEAAVDTWAPLLEGDDSEFMAHFQTAQALVALGRADEAQPLFLVARQRMPSVHPMSELLDKIVARISGPAS